MIPFAFPPWWSVLNKKIYYSLNIEELLIIYYTTMTKFS